MRGLAFLAVLAGVALTFAGCGAGGPVEPQAATTNTKPTTATSTTASTTSTTALANAVAATVTMNEWVGSAKYYLSTLGTDFEAFNSEVSVGALGIETGCRVFEGHLALAQQVPAAPVANIEADWSRYLAALGPLEMVCQSGGTEGAFASTLRSTESAAVPDVVALTTDLKNLGISLSGP